MPQLHKGIIFSSLERELLKNPKDCLTMLSKHLLVEDFKVMKNSCH